MKKKQIESSLRRQLAEQTPDVWERISSNHSQPSMEAQTAQKGYTVDFSANKTKKVLISAICFVLILSLVLGILLPLVLGRGESGTIIFPTVGYVSIDINPAVQFVLDKDGKLSSAKPLNEDARIVLKGREGELVGLSADQALIKYVDLAAQTGYISVTKKTNAVLLSAALSDEKSEKNLQTKLQSSLTNHFKEKGIYAVVLTDVKDNDVAQAAQKYGVSESKMRLIFDAQKMGVRVEESEYASISIATLYERMSERADEMEEYGSDELRERLEDAEERAEEKAEESIERLEKLLEKLEDEENVDEDALEAVEEAIETLEDAFEDHLNMDDAFDKLNAILDTLFFENADAQQLLGQLKEEVKSVAQEFESIEEELQKERERILLLQQQRNEKYAQEFNGYSKPPAFDEEFDDWLKEAEEIYFEYWEELKEQWQKELDD